MLPGWRLFYCGKWERKSDGFACSEAERAAAILALRVALKNSWIYSMCKIGPKGFESSHTAARPILVPSQSCQIVWIEHIPAYLYARLFEVFRCLEGI